jgi:hypothetical protein
MSYSYMGITVQKMKELVGQLPSNNIHESSLT